MYQLSYFQTQPFPIYDMCVNSQTIIGLLLNCANKKQNKTYMSIYRKSATQTHTPEKTTSFQSTSHIGHCHGIVTPLSTLAQSNTLKCSMNYFSFTLQRFKSHQRSKPKPLIILLTDPQPQSQCS